MIMGGPFVSRPSAKEDQNKRTNFILGWFNIEIKEKAQMVENRSIKASVTATLARKGISKEVPRTIVATLLTNGEKSFLPQNQMRK